MSVRNVDFFGILFEEYNYDHFVRNSPIVSVFCITYNHALYIRDCLDGFVKQETDFEYEVVIFDDASTDGTSDIIRKYSKNYPNLIHAFIAKENSFKNSCRGELSKLLRKECLKGKFVAFCEGDDFWTDDDKLQLQVSFLLSHPEYSLTIHNAVKLNYLSNSKSNMVDIESDRELDVRELIMQNTGCFPFCSFVGRKELFIDSFCLFTSVVQDWPLQLYASHIGKVYYFSCAKSTYRYMINNSWTSRTLLNKKSRLLNVFYLLEMLNRFNKLSEFKYETTIIEKQCILWASIIDVLLLRVDELSFLIKEIKKDNICFINIDYYLSDLKTKLDLIANRNCDEFGSDLKKVYNFYCKKSVIIFCASTAGERMLRILEKLSIDVDGFVDSDESKDGAVFCGKRVYGVSKLKDLNLREYIIQVASLDYDSQIVKRLQGIKNCNYISAHDFYISYFK